MVKTSYNNTNRVTIMTIYLKNKESGYFYESENKGPPWYRRGSQGRNFGNTTGGVFVSFVRQEKRGPIPSFNILKMSVDGMGGRGGGGGWGGGLPIINFPEQKVGSNLKNL